jgi:hypothetical protein
LARRLRIFSPAGSTAGEAGAYGGHPLRNILPRASRRQSPGRIDDFAVTPGAPLRPSRKLIQRVNHRAVSRDQCPSEAAAGQSGASDRELSMTDPRPTQSAAAPDAMAGVAALIARIEASPILACASQLSGWAPAGYDATDIRILEWIASHRRGERKQNRVLTGSPILAA